jgi:hypothetical protein
MIRPDTVNADKKRLLRVTAGNLRQSHLYVRGHYDFFPPDCVGGAKRSGGCRPIEIHFAGLDRTVTTDIGRDAKSGRPRGFFRARGPVGQFYAHHGVKPGDFVALERLSDRKYRLSVEPPEKPVPLECAEFFAGIELVRLALERQGWRVVFANDIDPKKAEMYRHNWPDDGRSRRCMGGQATHLVPGACRFSLEGRRRAPDTGATRRLRPRKATNSGPIDRVRQ